MEIDIDVLPSKFMELYSLAQEVKNGCQAGRLSYQLLYSSQNMISLYVSLVKTVKIQGSSQSQGQFDGVIKNYKLMIDNMSDKTHSQSLLQIANLAISILNNIENTIRLTKRDVSLEKYSLKTRLLNELHLDLVYLTRLSVTYQKYFDDKYIRKSNEIWRKYAPLIDMDPIILEFPQTQKVLAGRSWGLYMTYWSQKIDNVINEIGYIANRLEPIIKYESPDNPDYKNDFMQTFAKNAIDISIPIPLKEREEEEKQV